MNANIGNSLSFGQTPLNNSILNQRNDAFAHRADISSQITIYQGHRIQKQIKKAEIENQISQLDTEKTKNHISLQILENYLNVLLNKEIEQVYLSTYQNAEKLYQRAEITTQAGSTPQTTLAEAKATMAREFQNYKSSQINTKNTLLNLAILLNLPDRKNFDIEFWQSDSLPTHIPESQYIIEKAFQWLPEIKNAENKIQLSDIQTQITKTQRLPTLNANAGLETSYNNHLNQYTQQNFFSQYKNNFGQHLSLSLQIPIFNKNITKIQIEQSRINENLAQTQFLIQKQELILNIEKIRNTAENNLEVYHAAVESEKSSKISLDFAEKSFNAGRTSIYELNIARTNYAQVKSNLIQSKYNFIYQIKLLDFYLGKNFNQLLE